MNAKTASDNTTSKLAEFVHRTRIDDLGSATRHAAHRAFVNIIGCCIGGAEHEITAKTAQALMPFAGRGTATLLGRSERADILTATLINCVSSAAYSFDDTHAQTILHPAGAVATALLALAEERRMTGSEFLVAFVLGIDVASRLSKAVALAPAVADIAWSQTGIAAGIGAAAAVAKALQLDATGISAAIGIAALHASGFREAHGTMSATLIFGNAAQSGLRAALYAREGMTAPPAPLEGKHGYANLFSDRPHLAYLTDALGTPFEIEALAYKPYPCGIVIHPALDAALEWRRIHPGQSSGISRIVVDAHPSAQALANRPHPASVIEAKFSLHHWVAAALTFGRASIPEGQQAAISNPEVIRLRDCIEINSDDSLAAEAVRMTVFLEGGGSRLITVEQCKGSVANPMSDEDLNNKFRGQVDSLCAPAAEAALLAACWGLEDLADMAGIARQSRRTV